jgi:hypothetical protein
MAQGTVTAHMTGWIKAYYYDPLTNLQVTFAQPPTVVATALSRSGTPPAVSAPTISIPLIELPVAPPITLTIPDLTAEQNAVVADLNALQGYRFSVGTSYIPLVDAIFGNLITQLNKLMALWNTAISDLITLVVDIGAAFYQAKQDIQNVINSINSALSDTQAKMQAAVNTYQLDIQNSVNQGLSQIIPALYDQIGVPLSELITPVQIRNVAVDSFEFYSLSDDYEIQYVAIGTKL